MSDTWDISEPERDEPKMEELTCPNCNGISWTIWADLFESRGTLLILTAECTNEECQTKMNLGTVDGNEILEVPRNA